MNLDEWIDTVTQGLRTDRELWLEARQELQGHAEDVADEARAEGMADDDIDAYVLRRLGDTSGLADQLLAANHGRMSARGLGRAVLSYLVVPAALLLALWIAWGTWSSLAGSIGLTAMVNGHSPSVAQDFREVVPESSRRVVFGEEEKGAQRFAWVLEEAADDPVLVARHVMAVLSDGTSEERRQALDTGRKLDPNNGLYPMLQAAQRLDEAFEWKTQAIQSVQSDESLATFESDLQVALDAPVFTSHTGARANVIGEQTDRSGRFGDEVAVLGLMAQISVPEISPIMKLSKRLPALAAHLDETGQTERAIALLERWPELVQQVAASRDTLIQCLVISAVAQKGEDLLPLMEAHGLDETAAETRRMQTAFSALSDEFKARRGGDELGHTMSQHGSVLASITLPAIGLDTVTKADLAPGRLLDQVMLEQVAAGLFLVLLAFALLSSAVIFLRWSRLGKGTDVGPVLLLPDNPTWFRILGFGVLLPLLAYVIYSRLMPFSGREYSLLTSGTRFLTETIGLGLLMLLLVTWQTRRWIRRRADALGIPVSSGSWGRNSFGLCIGLLVLTLAGSLLVQNISHAWLVFVLLGLFLIVGFACGIRMLLARLENRDYSASLARTLLPVFSVAILLATVSLMPLLHQQERRLVKADQLISIPQDFSGFTKAEGMVVKDFGQRIAAILPR